MAQTLPEGITQQDLDRLARLDAAIKSATAEADALKKKVKKSFAGQNGTFVFDRVILKLSESIILNDKTFQEEYPYEEYPQYYAHKVDVSKVPESAKAEHFILRTSLSVNIAAEPVTLEV